MRKYNLDILISTHDAQHRHLLLPPQQEGVYYRINCQCRREPWSDALLQRRDVQLLDTINKGLSVSRNALMKRSQAEFMLFTDDDVVLHLSAILAAVEYIGRNEHLTFLLGYRAERPPPQHYGKALSYFNAGRSAVPQILLRRARIDLMSDRFAEEFGIGASYPIGEDYIFVTDLLKAGHKGENYPAVFGAHPHQSSGANWHAPRVLKARRQVLKRVFGSWHPAARLAYTVKHAHQLRLSALRFVMGL